MSDELLTSSAETNETGAVNRRTVVRLGANAAWAVPAISLVTAAPALAAVSGSASVSGVVYKLLSLGPLSKGVDLELFQWTVSLTTTGMTAPLKVVVSSNMNRPGLLFPKVHSFYNQTANPTIQFDDPARSVTVVVSDNSSPVKSATTVVAR